MDIARETVKKIVETLNDDDYFNVIKVFVVFSVDFNNRFSQLKDAVK